MTAPTVASRSRQRFRPRLRARRPYGPAPAVELPVDVHAPLPLWAESHDSTVARVPCPSCPSWIIVTSDRFGKGPDPERCYVVGGDWLPLGCGSRNELAGCYRDMPRARRDSTSLVGIPRFSPVLASWPWNAGSAEVRDGLAVRPPVFETTRCGVKAARELVRCCTCTGVSVERGCRVLGWPWR